MISMRNLLNLLSSQSAFAVMGTAARETHHASAVAFSLILETVQRPEYLTFFSSNIVQSFCLGSESAPETSQF